MYSGVISIFSERIKKGRPITIYGDGEQTRDFVNVADVVQANLLAMQGDLPKVNKVFNVATGKQISLLSLLSTLERLFDVTIERKFASARAGDIKHSGADISKAWKVLGYQPKGGLHEGLLKLIRN